MTTQHTNRDDGDTTVYRTKYERTDGAGDGEWSDLDCGCRWTFGDTQGVLFFILCDSHTSDLLPVDEVVEASGVVLAEYDEFHPDEDDFEVSHVGGKHPETAIRRPVKELDINFDYVNDQATQSIIYDTSATDETAEEVAGSVAAADPGENPATNVSFKWDVEIVDGDVHQEVTASWSDDPTPDAMSGVTNHVVNMLLRNVRYVAPDIAEEMTWETYQMVADGRTVPGGG